MKKKIWIMNHYATNSYFSSGGRHYWFAENLIKQGYEPTIFCANVRHNTNDTINIEKRVFSSDIKNGVPFVFVKTTKAIGNGIDRIKNMLVFYKNLFPTTKEYLKEYGKPDIIVASSVHPLTMVAAAELKTEYVSPSTLGRLSQSSWN